MSGTGALQPPGGGPITVIARCDLTIDGTIRSKGADAGADLLHLEGGCAVVINGLIESTAGGHGVPNSPPNHCYGPIANPSRPDKPQNSTACIEVWAGDSLVISSTGRLNADLGLSGDNDGTSWIDLFARGNITINGLTGNSSVPFSVHANGLGGSGGDGEEGGIIKVVSKQGSVTANGKALQASAPRGSNSDAGQITVEAALSVTFNGNTPTLEAKANDHGGSIVARIHRLPQLARRSGRRAAECRRNHQPDGLHGHSTDAAGDPDDRHELLWRGANGDGGGLRRDLTHPARLRGPARVHLRRGVPAGRRVSRGSLPHHLADGQCRSAGRSAQPCDAVRGRAAGEHG